MRIFAVFCTIFLILSASSAEARPKPWYWSWFPAHWEDQDFKPHLDDPLMPHNAQWEAGLYNDEDWHPNNWIKSKGSMRAVLDGFYKNEIIRKQDVDDETPILIVGDGFMNLSGQEKRRVTAFIDYAFQVTNSSPVGMYSIYYHRTKNLFGRGRPIGMYTPSGLQLQ